MVLMILKKKKKDHDKDSNNNSNSCDNTLFEDIFFIAIGYQLLFEVESLSVACLFPLG